MKLLKLLFGLSLNLGFIRAAGAQTTMRINISTAQNSHQRVAIDTFPKQTIKANLVRMDQDDATGVAELRTRGMTVTENIDKSKFVAMLAPVNAEFEK